MTVTTVRDELADLADEWTVTLTEVSAETRTVYRRGVDQFSAWLAAEQRRYLRARAKHPAAESAALFVTTRMGAAGGWRLSGSGVAEMIGRRCEVAGLRRSTRTASGTAGHTTCSPPGRRRATSSAWPGGARRPWSVGTAPAPPTSVRESPRGSWAAATAYNSRHRPATTNDRSLRLAVSVQPAVARVQRAKKSGRSAATPAAVDPVP